jgi:hypothetical protein
MLCFLLFDCYELVIDNACTVQYKEHVKLNTSHATYFSISHEQ